MIMKLGLLIRLPVLDSVQGEVRPCLLTNVLLLALEMIVAEEDLSDMHYRHRGKL